MASLAGIEPPDLMVQAMASHNKLTDRLYTGEDDPEVSDKVVDEVNRCENWTNFKSSVIKATITYRFFPQNSLLGFCG